MEMPGNFLVPLALVAWFPITIALFVLLSPRRALIASTIFGWLFLPEITLRLPGIPDANKATVIAMANLLCVFFFDSPKILSFRPCAWDAPMFVWIFAPFVSSMLNGFGPYDGFSTVILHSLLWGIPYLFGRLYFTDLASFRDLALGIVIGALVYVPFCWFEIRMSPRLHEIVYGYHQHSFGQHMRAGGFRPKVFLYHGLLVSLWLAMGTLAAYWLAVTQSRLRVLGIPILVVAGLLALTTIFSKSLGALVLLLAGGGALTATLIIRSRAFLLIMLCALPAYVVMRAVLFVDLAAATPAIAELAGTERAESFQCRIDNETMLIDKAHENFFFGYGNWSGNRVRNRQGLDISITDGGWIITYGKFGVAGLASFFLALLGSTAALLWRTPGRIWQHPSMAPVIAIATCLMLYAIDYLMNAPQIPIVPLCAGAMTAIQLRMAEAGI